MDGRKSIYFALCILLSTLPPVRPADVTKPENWPAWRGPRGDGTSQGIGIPTHFSDTDNVRWKTNLPGNGYSSPIVWGDRVFVTWCVEDEERRVLACLDRKDGKVVWQKTVLTAP